MPVMYDVMKQCIYAHMTTVAELSDSLTFFAYFALSQMRGYEKIANELYRPRTKLQEAHVVIQASDGKLINRMVQESGSTPRARRTSSASASVNASPTKITRSLKMGQAPTLQTLSSNMSQASTDIYSSSSSTAGQEEDQDDSKHSKYKR